MPWNVKAGLLMICTNLHKTHNGHSGDSAVAFLCYLIFLNFRKEAATAQSQLEELQKEFQTAKQEAVTAANDLVTTRRNRSICHCHFWMLVRCEARFCPRLLTS